MTNLEQLEYYDEAVEFYHNLTKKGKDPFQSILDSQRGFQMLVDSTYHSEMLSEPNNKLVEYLKYQNFHLNIEFNEVLESLVGASCEDSSSILKKWKKNYLTVNSQNVDSLSNEDKIEIAFELIDMFNFMINTLLPFNLSSRDIFIIWYNKNKINHLRQKEGY